MTRYAINLGGHGPLGHPWLRLWLQETNEKKEQCLLDVQSSTDEKLATTQDPQTLQNTPMKSNIVSIGCYVWLLPTGLPADRDCMLKLYMLVNSVRTVSWLLLGKTCPYLAHFICLGKGVAAILCCAKHVFMLFAISLSYSIERIKTL